MKKSWQELAYEEVYGERPGHPFTEGWESERALNKAVVLAAVVMFSLLIIPFLAGIRDYGLVVFLIFVELVIPAFLSTGIMIYTKHNVPNEKWILKGRERADETIQGAGVFFVIGMFMPPLLVVLPFVPTLLMYSTFFYMFFAINRTKYIQKSLTETQK